MPCKTIKEQGLALQANLHLLTADTVEERVGGQLVLIKATTLIVVACIPTLGLFCTSRKQGLTPRLTSSWWSILGCPQKPSESARRRTQLHCTAMLHCRVET